MESTVIFRDFEERDIDFIYRCKNDEKLNSRVVAQHRPFTYEEATEWVHGCMGEHDIYKYWAIATNDNVQRIVGWVSVAQINYTNKSVFFHGIVIGDSDYKDGMAWIESYLFVFQYVFEILKFQRLYGANIVGHKESSAIARALFFTIDEIKREVINNKPCDVECYYITEKDYNFHKNNDDYDVYNIIDRILKLSKM